MDQLENKNNPITAVETKSYADIVKKVQFENTQQYRAKNVVVFGNHTRYPRRRCSSSEETTRGLENSDSRKYTNKENCKEKRERSSIIEDRTGFS